MFGDKSSDRMVKIYCRGLLIIKEYDGPTQYAVPPSPEITYIESGLQVYECETSEIERHSTGIMIVKRTPGKKVDRFDVLFIPYWRIIETVSAS